MTFDLIKTLARAGVELASLFTRQNALRNQTIGAVTINPFGIRYAFYFKGLSPIQFEGVFGLYNALQ